MLLKLKPRLGTIQHDIAVRATASAHTVKEAKATEKVVGSS